MCVLRILSREDCNTTSVEIPIVTTIFLIVFGELWTFLYVQKDFFHVILA
jgi:hypothetical protein